MTYQPPFTITTEIIDYISAISEQVGFVQQYMYAANFCFLKCAFPFNLRIKKTRQRPCAKVYPWRVALFYVHSLFDGYLIEASRKRFVEHGSYYIAISCVVDAYLMEAYL